MSWFRKHPYDRDMRKAQDQELLLRTFEESKFGCLPETLMGYRLEPSGLKRNLIGRWFFCKALTKYGVRQRRFIGLLTGLMMQGMKAVVEVFVFLFNASTRLQQRRFSQLGDADRMQWYRLWKSISDRKN